MSENTVNIPLLREVVEWVEWQESLDLSKRSWNQSSWFIDVAARLDGAIEADAPAVDCFDIGGDLAKAAVQSRPECGTAMCVAGYINQFHRPQRVELQGEALFDTSIQQFVEHGRVAARTLGLNEFQEDHLFDADNDATTIRRIAEEIAGESL